MDAALIAERIPTFSLVLMRVSGIVMTAPPFWGTTVPGVVRALIALLLGLMVLPTAPVWSGEGVWMTVAAAAGELVLGLSIGFLAQLLFAAVQGAGEWIDLQMGFGIMHVIDPQFGQSVPLSGNFLHLVMMLLFFSVDGHHMVLRALFASFTGIPPGGVRWHGAVFGGIVEQFAWVLYTALQISLPVIAVLFLTTLALGILARSMPQMNVFIVGIPLQIGLGLWVFLAMLPALGQVFLIRLDEAFLRIDAFLAAIGGSVP